MTIQIDGLLAEAEQRCAQAFAERDAIEADNTAKVLDAFRACRVSDTHFAGTTGYGYDDGGRQALEQAYARIFGCESALVRIGFVNGTHAIMAALFAALAPGEVLLSVSGSPYDTLRTAIGIDGEAHGSLRFYGIGHRQLELLHDGSPDYASIAEEAKRPEVGAVFVQRSRGYSTRRALSVTEIGEIVSTVKRINPELPVIVDNCYGEFTDISEPTDKGADLIAGSLIKNPGGGLANTGGYVAGRAELVSRAANRLTVPGIGGECGPTLGQSRSLFQGLFMAPHVTAQALKTAVFCAGMLEKLEYTVSPGSGDRRSDIIQMVELKTARSLERFCAGIQSASPVDAFATPVSAAMPGYDCPVIMAAGTFVQGASIELSADGPMREPYAAYLQGSLTYESGKLAIMRAIGEMLG